MYNTLISFQQKNCLFSTLYNAWRLATWNQITETDMYLGTSQRKIGRVLDESTQKQVANDANKLKKLVYANT
jgi:hypothetical protein